MVEAAGLGVLALPAGRLVVLRRCRSTPGSTAWVCMDWQVQMAPWQRPPRQPRSSGTHGPDILSSNVFVDLILYLFNYFS